jgi:hypothetical protein
MCSKYWTASFAIGRFTSSQQRAGPPSFCYMGTASAQRRLKNAHPGLRPFSII